METELTSLCQSVLEDFNLVLFYLPLPAHGSQSASEEEEEHDSVCSVLPDSLIFKMAVTCLMVVHSLKRGGEYGPKELITTSAAHFTQCHYVINYVALNLISRQVLLHQSKNSAGFKQIIVIWYGSCVSLQAYLDFDTSGSKLSFLVIFRHLDCILTRYNTVKDK